MRPLDVAGKPGVQMKTQHPSAGRRPNAPVTLLTVAKLCFSWTAATLANYLATTSTSALHITRMQALFRTLLILLQAL